MSTQKQAPTVINAKGSELPPEWARSAGIGPDQRVRVIIAVDDDAHRQRAREQMDILLESIRKEAAETGLSEEKLKQLLAEDD